MPDLLKAVGLAALTWIACGCPAHAENIQRVASAEAARSLNLWLGQPDYRELSGEAIQKLIAGKVLILDTDYTPVPGVKINKNYRGGGCPPKAHFWADGRWTAYECHVAARVFDGRWTVEEYQGGHRLCVEAVDYVKNCRFVWLGPQPEQIIMPEDTYKDERGRPIVYILYRLEKDD